MTTPDTEKNRTNGNYEVRHLLYRFCENIGDKYLKDGVEVASLEIAIDNLLTSRDTYWKGTNQVFVNNIIEDIENMKGVYSAQDAITKALEIIKRHTIR